MRSTCRRSLPGQRGDEPTAVIRNDDLKCIQSIANCNSFRSHRYSKSPGRRSAAAAPRTYRPEGAHRVRNERGRSGPRPAPELAVVLAQRNGSPPFTLSDRSADPAVEEGASDLGIPQGPREDPSPTQSDQLAGHRHRARGVTGHAKVPGQGPLDFPILYCTGGFGHVGAAGFQRQLWPAKSAGERIQRLRYEQHY